MAERVALIGVGIMGSGMAANWLRKGFDVSVYNRTRAKTDGLAALGARVAETPADAAHDADYVVAMVSDDDVSRALWLGPDGALAAAKPDAVLIEASTLTPDWIRELAARVTQTGRGFLDAPVGGSKAAAADGKLVMFVGGSAETLARAQHVLDAVSVKSTRIGDNGAGATWKLINNMMAGSQLAVLAEGIALARRAGIDMALAEELIRSGPTASGMVGQKLPRLVADSFDNPDFALEMYAKDLRYILGLARTLGVPVEMAHATERLVKKAHAKGHGGKDFAAIVEALRD